MASNSVMITKIAVPIAYVLWKSNTLARTATIPSRSIINKPLIQVRVLPNMDTADIVIAVVLISSSPLTHTSL